MTIIRYVENDRAQADRSADGYLFSRFDLDASLRVQQQLIDAEIDQYDPTELSAAEPDAVATYLEVKYLVDTPTLQEDQRTVDEGPCKIDVQGASSRSSYDRGRPTVVDGVEVRIHIPVGGDPALFEAAPRVMYMDRTSAPGRVVAGDVVLTYRGIELHPHHLREQIDRDLAQVRRRLAAVAANIEEWNAEMRRRIRERVAGRRQRLGALTSGLGIPLRPRADAVEGFDRNAVVRRAIRPGTAGGEPFLDVAHYEDILGVLAKMSVVMERAPSAFATMDEEAIRHQFLVPLNVLYEGQAHAEAFNFQGKTDILIRVQDRAVFIAECKFWTGEKALAAAIGQLLGYTSWRDTKTALLVFNRRRNFSAVLAKIPAVIEGHPAFVRRLPYDVDGGSRYFLRRPGDRHLELMLTVLAFDVPTGAAATPPTSRQASGPRRG